MYIAEICTVFIIIIFNIVMYDFGNQAKEQHEVLEGMGKRMSTLFEGIAKFYAFDPHKYTMEEFFADIKNFSKQFLVSEYLFLLKSLEVFLFIVLNYVTT